MKRPTWPVQGGFTLVEILIVVVIIAILAGLTVPAVNYALAKVEEKTIVLEMNLLTQALEAYRSEYGSYPPDFTDRAAVIKHLNRIFPRRLELRSVDEIINPPKDNPYSDFSLIGPHNALAFWLRGFYPNPEYPITGNGVGERQPLLRLPENMIRTIGDRNPTMPAQDGDLDTPGEMFGPSRVSAAPFIYFDSRSCSGCTKSYEVDDGIVKQFNMQMIGFTDGGIATPYMSDRTGGTPKPDYINEDTFQIISAGRDGIFSTVQPAPNEGKWYPSGLNYSPEDNDNICNFSTKTLGDSIE